MLQQLILRFMSDFCVAYKIIFFIINVKCLGIYEWHFSVRLWHILASSDAAAEIGKMTNKTGLWKTELNWYSPSVSRLGLPLYIDNEFGIYGFSLN